MSTWSHTYLWHGAYIYTWQFTVTFPVNSDIRSELCSKDFPNIIFYSVPFHGCHIVPPPMSYLAKVDNPSNIRRWTDILQLIISLERERERMTSICWWQNWKRVLNSFLPKEISLSCWIFCVKRFYLLLLEGWNIKIAITVDWMCVSQFRIFLWNRECICAVYSSPTEIAGPTFLAECSGLQDISAL